MFNSLVGRKLAQYDILELLTQGGMGTVYKGYQESVGRRVAIKVLPPHPGMDAQYAQRFQLEARAIGALQHPHILQVIDSGAQDDILYIVMAFADGGSLADLVTDAPLALPLVEKLLHEIASALDYAHRKGIVHRDIKPGNILLDDEGHALLADFGIVKLLGEGANLTGTAIVGTPAYMSPEQGQGKDVDGRADIYALGAMVFEMLTGKQMYAGDTPMMTIMKHIQDSVPDVRDFNAALPPEMSAVLARALAKNPADRYASAQEFAEAFSAAIYDETDQPTRRYPKPSTQQFHKPPATPPPATLNFNAKTVTDTPAPMTVPSASGGQSNRTLIIGGGVLLVLVLLIGGFLVLNGTPPPAPPSTDEAEAPRTTPVAVAENFGELRFNSINALGDALTLRVTGLKPATTGTKYAAWLMNTLSGDTLALGEIIKDAFGDGTLLFTDSEGRMLPATYNALVITEETTIGDKPAGATRYSGSVPIPVTAALRAIFVTAADGLDNGSLLDAVLTEAKFGQQHSGLAASATSVGGMQVHAEHTINILNGTKDDFNNNGRGENPGRGIGVYVFLDRIEATIDSAANDPDASLDVQSNAELISVCTRNVRQWVDQAQAFEREMVIATTLEAVSEQAADSTELLTQVLDGIDANQNGQVDPFEGECGLAQLPEYGIQFGNIMLREGGWNAE